MSYAWHLTVAAWPGSNIYPNRLPAPQNLVDQSTKEADWSASHWRLPAGPRKWSSRSIGHAEPSSSERSRSPEGEGHQTQQKRFILNLFAYSWFFLFFYFIINFFFTKITLTNSYLLRCFSLFYFWSLPVNQWYHFTHHWKHFTLTVNKQAISLCSFFSFEVLRFKYSSRSWVQLWSTPWNIAKPLAAWIFH